MLSEKNKLNKENATQEFSIKMAKCLLQGPHKCAQNISTKVGLCSKYMSEKCHCRHL